MLLTKSIYTGWSYGCSGEQSFLQPYGDRWTPMKNINQNASISFLKSLHINILKEYFNLTGRKIFHLWSKETGLFNVWAFSGEIFNFEEDIDLLPDSDDDDGCSDGDNGYDSVDLLPEYFFDHVLDVFGIKWNDTLGVWQKKFWLGIYWRVKRSTCFGKLWHVNRLLIVPFIWGVFKMKRCGLKRYFSVWSSDFKVFWSCFKTQGLWCSWPSRFQN